MLPFTSILGQVSGQIIDADGQPVFGAHVQARPTKLICRTGEDGYFFFHQLTDADTLIVSHIAYVSDTLLGVNASQKSKLVLEERIVSFSDLIITPEFDPSFQLVQAVLHTRPINSSQELLKLVPGLFIGQHAGGGKAEQLFLRGFDLDHGTDLTLTVDNMPVNMVSHAHGQGYSDLHFLIPEAIQHVSFEKGPYDLRYGNFNVAGNVHFQTRALMDDQIKIEAGAFGTRRLFGSFNLLNNPSHKSFLAAEAYFTDGPFDSPQGLRKYNVHFKEQWRFGDTQRIGLQLMGFNNTWTASGQIPDRLVRSGNLSRFGAVDDTEGGTTQRNSLSLDFSTSLLEGTLFTRIDRIHYDFRLYSNFTFFLNDPVNGDQIRQSENRKIWNVVTRFERGFDLFGNRVEGYAGINFRQDRIFENELSHTLNREQVLDLTQFGDIAEGNLSGFVGLDGIWGRFAWSVGARFDHFNFIYHDRLISASSQETKGFVSPKIKVTMNATERMQVTLKAARSFHSNDARVVTRIDTLSTLPAAYSSDLVLNWQPSKKLYLDISFYHTQLEQELVYVGDEGIVEPSDKSVRRGVDLGLRLEPVTGLLLYGDINFADARFSQLEKGANYVPLAARLAGSLGLDYNHRNGFQFGMTYAYMSDRPANEDNTISALGYGITSMKCSYIPGKLALSVEIRNLFNVEWNEAQFATESRLQNEQTPVEELHFTPGIPFFFKSSVAYRF